MIGPTGVGKTEISRRLAKLAQAPFIKVEATKFTEVGYVGRDVESVIRDLTDLTIKMTKEEERVVVQSKAEKIAEEKLLRPSIAICKDRKKKGIDSGTSDRGYKVDEKVDHEKYERKIKGTLERRQTKGQNR